MRACSSTNLSVLLEKYMYGVRKSKSWLSLSLCSGYSYLGSLCSAWLILICSSTNLSVLLEKYMYGVRKSKSWLSLSLCSGYILIWE